jgi:hypothetical protein
MFLVGLFKKFLVWLFSPIVGEIVKQELTRLMKVDPPKLKELKISYARISRKMTVWDAMDNYPHEISLCVNWIDNNGLEEFKCYTGKDLATFKHILQNLKYPYKEFESVSLHVKPNGSNSSIIERLTTGRDSRYESNQLINITKPLIEWINLRPEMLI